MKEVGSQMSDETRDDLADLTAQPGDVSADDDFDGLEDDSQKPENRYYFRANGKVLSIPLLHFLPVQSALCFEQGKNIEGLLIGADADVREFILSLKGSGFKRFMERWEAKSKVSSGESQASSASSASIGAPSSTTSFGQG